MLYNLAYRTCDASGSSVRAAVVCNSECNRQADFITRVNWKQTQLILDRRHGFVLVAVVRRFKVLRRSGQKRLQVALCDVGESDHLLAGLNHTTLKCSAYPWHLS